MRILKFLLILILISTPAYAVSGTTCYDLTELVSLLHFNGTNGSTTFTDEKTITWTAVGNAALTTTSPKFGSASLGVDGTGDYITAADNARWDIGTSNYTVEFWINFAADTSIYAFSHGAGPNFGIQYNTTGNVWENYHNGASVVTSGVWSPVVGTWYHIALTRSGSSVRFFIDGTQSGSTGTSAADITGGATVFSIGAFNDGSNTLNGKIDEFSLIDGFARWTGNFTAPTAEYTECVTTNAAKFMGFFE